MNEKQKLRKQMKATLNELTEAAYVQFSKRITSHLVSSSLWKEAQTVALTVSVGKEVDTKEMIRLAWKENKTVAVPRTNMKERTMMFYEINHFDQLEETKIGLFEPKVDGKQALSPNSFDLVIVPGLAFTKEGFRLGYGGGFYDRFLQKVNAPTVSLAFPCQIVKTLPTEPHDRTIDYIITPDGFCT